jgi:alpha-L-arabinofuranosidase
VASEIITNTLPTTSSTGFGPLYWVAGYNNQSNSHIFKAAVYNSTSDVPVSITFEDSKSTKATLTVLTQSADADELNGLAMNVMGGPNVVATTVTEISAGYGGAFKFSLPNLSVAVLSTS